MSYNKFVCLVYMNYRKKIKQRSKNDIILRQSQDFIKDI